MTAQLIATLFFVVLLALVVGIVIGVTAGWKRAENHGRHLERKSTARAMATIRKHYAVPVPTKKDPVLTVRGAEKLAKEFGLHNVVPLAPELRCPMCESEDVATFDNDETSNRLECARCGHDWPCDPVFALAEKNLAAAVAGCEGKGTSVDRPTGELPKGMTAPEWCAANGTSMGEMADAQELAEQEEWENQPVGRCGNCGAPVYTTEGFCARCRACKG